MPPTGEESKKSGNSKRGGARPGAGRKPGRPDRATAAQKEGLEAEARKYGKVALLALVEIAKSGESESARVAAANGLLDRGWGKPRQAVEHTGEGGGPVAVTVTHRIVDPAK